MTLSGIYKTILEMESVPLWCRRALIILINWTHQSFLYLNNYERGVKASFELVIASLTLVAWITISRLELTLTAIILALAFAHTLDWTFNGHLFALLKILGLHSTPQQEFIDYIADLELRASRNRGISWVACYGSLARSQLSQQSDLDVRVRQKPGFINGFRTALFVTRERGTALLARFPIDIYAISRPTQLDRLRDDELPIVIYDSKKGGVGLGSLTDAQLQCLDFGPLRQANEDMD